MARAAALLLLAGLVACGAADSPAEATVAEKEAEATADEAFADLKQQQARAALQRADQRMVRADEATARAKKAEAAAAHAMEEEGRARREAARFKALAASAKAQRVRTAALEREAKREIAAAKQDAALARSRAEAEASREIAKARAGEASAQSEASQLQTAAAWAAACLVALLLARLLVGVRNRKEGALSQPLIEGDVEKGHGVNEPRPVHQRFESPEAMEQLERELLATRAKADGDVARAEAQELAAKEALAATKAELEHLRSHADVGQQHDTLAAQRDAAQLASRDVEAASLKAAQVERLLQELEEVRLSELAATSKLREMDAELKQAAAAHCAAQGAAASQAEVAEAREAEQKAGAALRLALAELAAARAQVQEFKLRDAMTSPRQHQVVRMSSALRSHPAWRASPGSAGSTTSPTSGSRVSPFSPPSRSRSVAAGHTPTTASPRRLDAKFVDDFHLGV